MISFNQNIKRHYLHKKSSKRVVSALPLYLCSNCYAKCKGMCTSLTGEQESRNMRIVKGVPSLKILKKYIFICTS